MSYSLLAHLYPHIRGSQEDIATYSLQYLLYQSKDLNKAFTKRISDILHIDVSEVLQYVCQVTGKSEEKERPDMAGLGVDCVKYSVFKSFTDFIITLYLYIYPVRVRKERGRPADGTNTYFGCKN